MAEARDHLEQAEALLREAGVLPPENRLQDDTKREELEREIQQLSRQIRAAQQVDRSHVATTTREDRERAAKAMFPKGEQLPRYMLNWIQSGAWVPGGVAHNLAEHAAQAIATARAEGEAKGRAELGATLVRDLGAMATSLAGQSDGDTAAALKAQAEATQREAVHLALIAELAEALCFFLPQRNTHPVPVDELLARASDATRNVRREDDRA